MFTEEAPGFEGIFYDKANPMITDLLAEKGALLKLDFFVHSYPHDWRTKNLLSIGQHHNGLLQSINSVKTSLMKSRKWTGSFLGAKHACTT